MVGNVLYPASGADRQGRAYVFLGGPSGVGPGPQTDIPNPDGTDAYFGTHVGAGDVDGDGFSDLIVGSLPGTRAGRVHVYRGSGTGVSMTSSWILNFPDGAGSYFRSVRRRRAPAPRAAVRLLFTAPQRFTLPSRGPSSEGPERLPHQPRAGVRAWPRGTPPGGAPTQSAVRSPRE
ncbi:MAG: FG-GAP repeat protein [Sandaracinaceae bacterium]|nr:FG-GAP repeat protein [Sandaracinaceae bacterium]